MGSALTSLSASGETDTHIFFLVLPCALLLQQGFLNLSTTDTWGWMLPCWWREWGQGACEGVKDGVGVCPVHCRRFSSLPGLYPLDDSSKPSPPQS